jgi:hypothetical protein
VAYRWLYQDGEGHETAGPQQRFEDQVAAEDWLGQAWQDLLDNGVLQVTLLHDEAEVYGPMSLLPS